MFNLKENILLAINGLRSNKMRALLTMLGIIIGISSVITIVTIGDSLTRSITDVFNDLGANSISLRLNDKPDEYGNIDWSRPWGEEDMITQEMIDQYMEVFGDRVKAWAVSESAGSGQVLNGRREARCNVIGVNANALGIQNVDVVAGHDLQERDVSGNKRVAVVSDKMVNDLFPDTGLQEALGKEVRVRMSQGTFTFMIVGVYHFEVSGVMAGAVGDTSSNLFVPVGVAKDIQRVSNDDIREGYYYLQIRGNDNVTDSRAFAQETEDFFNKRFYRGNRYVGTVAYSMDSEIDMMTQMLGTMKLAISVIAAISLLVGGIGVMNIMLVSVTERTREIGTRKALGAKNLAIRIQFIVESMIICMFGGIIGVTLGTVLGRVGSMLLQAPGWPSISIVVIAVGFSMAIGVFFGYYPANKAAKLDPIEALRYE
ncbi:MAG: FtsX-like permease family protein [Anaerotruncus sp.]|nr:FtsX-like permease family protein [Anaerotruncus sp.]